MKLRTPHYTPKFHLYRDGGVTPDEVQPLIAEIRHLSLFARLIRWLRKVL